MEKARRELLTSVPTGFNLKIHDLPGLYRVAPIESCQYTIAKPEYKCRALKTEVMACSLILDLIVLSRMPERLVELLF